MIRVDLDQQINGKGITMKFCYSLNVLRYLQNFRYDILVLGIINLVVFRDKLNLNYWRYCLTHLNRRLSVKDICEILDQLIEAFQTILIDVSRMVSNITVALKSKGAHDAFNVGEVGSLLVDKSFSLRFQEAEKNIFDSWGLSVYDFKALLNHFSSDSEIYGKTQHLIEMYQNAIRGELPISLGITLPNAFKSTESVLGILQKIQQRKLELFSEILQQYTSKEEVTQKLVKATHEAEEGVLKKHSDLPSSIFQCVLNMYSKDPSFKSKKDEMDEHFSNKVIQLMRDALTAEATKNDMSYKQSSSSSTKIIQMSQDDLHKLLKEPSEKCFLLCLVLSDPNDSVSEQKLKDFKEAITQFERCHPSTRLSHTVFAFIEIQEISPSFLSEFTDDSLEEIQKDSSLYMTFKNGVLQEKASNPFQALDQLRKLL